MFWGWFQGDYVRGEQLARTAIDTWRRLNPHALVWYLGIFAMLLAKMGQHAEATSNLDELETLTGRLPQGSIPTGQALSWVATVSLTLGDRARLARLYPQLVPFRGCMMTGGLIDRLLGEIAIIQGDLPAARSALAVAETFARREGHRWELAQVLVAQANLALATGGRTSGEQARQLLHSAQGHYQYFGNQAEVDVLERRLQHVAQRVTLPDGLSRREAEVLRAVAAGKSNRAIAQELALSPRTVENHLATIYAKIGVENRASAVAFTIHHGLA